MKNSNGKEVEVSIFLVSDQEFRRRVVEKINDIIITCSRIEDRLNDLEDKYIDDLESDDLDEL